MLSKCANPKCKAQLKYVHEGRLFVIWPRAAVAASQPQIEYKWLCGQCCRSMTLTEEGAIQVFRQGWFRAIGERIRAYHALL